MDMDRKSLQVLVIEDNPDDIQLLRRYLGKTSFDRIDIQHCERLANGLEFLEEKDGHIDVILLDLGLPDGYGLDTFTKVHQLAPKIPIIVLSGQDDENLATQAVREGAQDYLVKGKFDGDLLVRSMRYSLERIRTEEALRLARDELETRVLERTSELAQANAALNRLIAEEITAILTRKDHLPEESPYDQRQREVGTLLKLQDEASKMLRFTSEMVQKMMYDMAVLTAKLAAAEAEIRNLQAENRKYRADAEDRKSEDMN